MKYMGSKRAMLANGLGTTLRRVANQCDRVVDLFCGAASVSWFAAEQLGKPVFSADLQQYAVALARAVVERTVPLDSAQMAKRWLNKVEPQRREAPVWHFAEDLDSGAFNTVTWSKKARMLSRHDRFADYPVMTAYGGHYFSPTQALTLDTMIELLPPVEPMHSACLASTIIAASKCAASPGHTAQPFKAAGLAAPYLREAWLRNPIHYAGLALKDICLRFAKRPGKAQVANAIEIASNLSEGDLVFVDPPYSGVHYSRFYHVLETIARGQCGKVEGIGRYPPPSERPTSSFSRKTESGRALQVLLERLAAARCTIVFTFPADECSNGLSGSTIEKIAKNWFGVSSQVVNTRFSTLGGNGGHRAARKKSKELIFLMKPRS